MGDGKQWFKVWTSILTDPSMEDQHNKTLGVWVRSGALVAQHGEKGSLKLSVDQLKKRLHLSSCNDAELSSIFEDLKKINVDVKVCNGSATVTFKKWHKYQVDNSSLRVSKYRQNVTVQEEKRREENKTKNKKKKKDTDPRIAVLINSFNDTFIETFKIKYTTKGAMDALAFKRLLNRFSPEDLKGHIPKYFASQDMFFKKNGYDISRFETFMGGMAAGAYKQGGDHGTSKEPGEFVKGAEDYSDFRK